MQLNGPGPILRLAAMLCLAVVSASCTPTSRVSTAEGSTELSRRGQDLNKEIFDAYRGVKGLPSAVAQSAMAAIISKYIKEGSNFSDAEEILRAADFSVSAHPANYPVMDWPYSDDIVALLNRPLGRDMISVTKLSVNLRTAEHLRYTTIREVLVSYTVSMP